MHWKRISTYAFGAVVELLVLGGREDRGGRVVLAMFRHPALGLGGSRFGEESRYDVTWRKFQQAERDVTERGVVGEMCEGVLGTRW